MATTTCPGCGADLGRHEESTRRLTCCPYCQYAIAAADSAPPSQAHVVAEVPPPASPRRYEDVTKPPLRRKSPVWTVLLTCGIIAVVILVMCGGGGTLMYFLFIHEIEEPFTAADRDLLITAERVKPFLATLRIDPALGKPRKLRHLDGSRELEYEYESTEGANSVLYISHNIGVERSAESARGAYGGLGIGTSIGLRLENKNIRQVERADLWSWGDTSRCIVLYNGDAPVGNIFMGCKGRRYFQLTLSGVYFDKADAIRELLQQVLQKLESYEG